MAPTQEMTFLNTLMPLAGIVFTIAIGVILLNQHFRKNLYRQMLQQEELKTKHQNDLLRANIEAQEEERKRMARDMHDELGTVLSIARMQLVQMEQQQTSNGALGTSLQRVRLTTEAALTSLRRLSHQLMPPQLEEFGLIKTLESTCSQIIATNHINVQFTADKDLPRWHSSIELGLYRICMELINNTIKHAAAKNIQITIGQEGQQIIIFSYRDDGRGLMERKQVEGLGFRNMETRASSIGATLETGNGENGGFRAIVRIPSDTPLQ
jgi:signal transduction histidine kinase